MEIREVDERIAWGVAGLPILVSAVQTTLTLVGVKAIETPLASVAGVFHDVDVFREASWAFWQSPGVVVGLFAVIAVGWFVEGYGLFVANDRNVAFAAAGLVSVLFLSLFAGVYAPVLGSVPPVQAVLFLLFPVVAASAAVVAPLAHDWDVKLAADANEDIARVEARLDDAVAAFEREWSTRIGDEDAFESVAPTGVERAREERATFETRVDEIRGDLRALRGSDVDAETLRRRADDLLARAEVLEPVDRVADIECGLWDRVTSGVRTTYGSIRRTAPSGHEYELVNLPTRYRSVSIEALDVEAHLDRISNVLVANVESDLPAVGDAVREVDDHLAALDAHLDERGNEFESAAAAVESDAAAVRSTTDSVPGRVGTRLGEFVVDGRHDELPAVTDVERELDEARERHAECRFDDALRMVEDAADETSKLLAVAEFVRAAVASVDDAGARVEIPDSVPTTVVEDLCPAVRRALNVDAEVTDGTLVVGGTEPPPVDEPAETTTDDAVEQDAARPEDVLDAVLYVFRELSEADGDGRLQLQTGTLPSFAVEPGTLQRVETFAARQTDVVTSFSVPNDAPPGYVELDPAGDRDPADVASELHSRYRERYGTSDNN